MKKAFTPVALTVALLAIGPWVLSAQPKPPAPDELKALQEILNANALDTRVAAADRHPFNLEDYSALHSARAVAISPEGNTILYHVIADGTSGPVDKREWYLVDASGIALGVDTVDFPPLAVTAAKQSFGGAGKYEAAAAAPGRRIEPVAGARDTEGGDGGKPIEAVARDGEEAAVRGDNVSPRKRQIDRPARRLPRRDQRTAEAVFLARRGGPRSQAVQETGEMAGGRCERRACHAPGPGSARIAGCRER